MGSVVPRDLPGSGIESLSPALTGRFFTTEPPGTTLVTPRTAACQAPLSMGFSRQGYWSGSPCLPPGDLPDPGVEPRSLALQADSLPSVFFFEEVSRGQIY